MEIKEIALNFRNALDSLKIDGVLDNFYGFRNFPTGACGGVSDLFIIYIRQEYNINLEYWIGCFKDNRSHAWVMLNNTCIDLTADQFNSVFGEYDKVIVCDRQEYPLNNLLIRRDKGKGPTSASISHYWLLYTQIKDKIKSF
ncbi:MULTISPECIES: hypothetical protein [Acinetobacter]|uniref:hypothetical protein n=1 Tax=Acinetobacter TaxID=469 RepID=UPI00254F1DA7|nr:MULTISPECIES: hypothetical protein [Acinetobacter]